MLKRLVRAHLPLIFFLAFVTISFFAMLFFQSRSLREMKERNERILAHYSQILSVSPLRPEIEDIDWQLYVSEFKLSPNQSLALQDYTRSVIDKAVALSQVDLEVNSIVEAKAVAMYQETKDLLEMQFAKIQHESESLQIWCGILTVVFLIFSFYSLFKTDELVRQGREGLRELSSLQAKGRKDIKEMIDEGNSKIQVFDTNSSAAISRAARKAVFERQRIMESVENATNAKAAEVNDKIISANLALDIKYQALEEALVRKAEDLVSSAEIKDNKLLDQVRLQVENLGVRVTELENKEV